MIARHWELTLKYNRGQSYKDFYNSGQIYKRVLRHENNALTYDVIVSQKDSNGEGK